VPAVLLTVPVPDAPITAIATPDAIGARGMAFEINAS
jgi:hypothetical protein